VVQLKPSKQHSSSAGGESAPLFYNMNWRSSLKATAKCPGCGHEIATSESVESFSGKNWSSDFLVIKEMTLDWTIDVEGVEVQFAPQENAEWVDKRNGEKRFKQKAHLHRWKVAERAEAEAEAEDDSEELEALAVELARKKRKSTSDKMMLALIEKRLKSKRK